MRNYFKSINLIDFVILALNPALNRMILRAFLSNLISLSEKTKNIIPLPIFFLLFYLRFSLLVSFVFDKFIYKNSVVCRD